MCYYLDEGSVIFLKRFFSVIPFLLLALTLTSCGDARDQLTSLDDITDAQIVSGELGYAKVKWSGYWDGELYSASWRSMTGTDACVSLELTAEQEVTLTYTVTDAGDGFKTALVLPDDSLIYLVEGENTLLLPTGESRLVLAAYKTGGAFTLESSETGIFHSADED